MRFILHWEVDRACRKLFADWYYHMHPISKHTYSPADKTPISQVGVQNNKPRTKKYTRRKEHKSINQERGTIKYTKYSTAPEIKHQSLIQKTDQ